MARFSGFRTLKIAQSVEDIRAYLQNGLALSLKELQAGLNSLSFLDNFQSQQIDVFLPAGATVGVSHNLGVIPSIRLIVKANGSTIDDSLTPWTETAVYFRNTGATDITATIILMR
jgi:hypothetical protein